MRFVLNVFLIFVLYITSFNAKSENTSLKYSPARSCILPSVNSVATGDIPSSTGLIIYMKLPKNFSFNDIKDLKNLYPLSSKEDILARFKNYRWRHLQNIANCLHIKRHVHKTRHGNIEKLLTLNKESCYWLGLIAADGCIYENGTLKIDLCQTDSKYLSKLANYLNTKLYFYKRYDSSKIGGKGTVRLKIKDYIHGVALRNLFKISGQKTYNPISIEFLKNKYQIFCFFIGMVDGDGTINNKALHIDMHINYYDFMLNLGNKLKYFNFISNFTMQKYKSMVRFSIHKNKDLIKIKELVIKLDLPILKRKWNNISCTPSSFNLILENHKSTIKHLRKKGFKLQQICNAIHYSSCGSLHNFCKNHSI